MNAVARDSDSLRVQLRTEQVGSGLGSGSYVVLDGVRVGTVASVESPDITHQIITVELDRRRVAGLTDAMTIAYAPENLFGITAINLQREPGGSRLTEGTTIDLAARGGSTDATMGLMLESLTNLTTGVLTPQTADLLAQAADALDEFTPLFEALIGVTRSYVGARKYAPSTILNSYAGLLEGAEPFLTSTVDVIDYIQNIAVLKSDHKRTDDFIHIIAQQVIPGAAKLMTTMERYYPPYMQMLTPLMAALANTVPNSRSRQQLTQLLTSLDGVFTGGADPALKVALVILAPMWGSTAPRQFRRMGGDR
jgi:hypothetical protein